MTTADAGRRSTGTAARLAGTVRIPLLDHLFGPDVHVAFGPEPAGYRVVEEWRVIPWRSHPKFLLPVEPAAARRVLASHHRLRRGPSRVLRLGAAGAVGALARVQGDGAVLRASVPADSIDSTGAAALLTEHLRRRVPGAVGTALSLRAFHPRAKPTLQLLDARGRVIAFAKVACDPETSRRVEREARLMTVVGEALLRNGCHVLSLPAVLDHGRFAGFTFSVVEPLPVRTRVATSGQAASMLAPLTAFAQALGHEPVPLASTSMVAEVEHRVRAVAVDSAGLRSDTAEALVALLDATVDQDGDALLPTGCVHGDWVPWNLGWVGQAAWSWDLEYGSISGPVGFDAVRWLFQVAHVLRRCDLPDALAAAAVQAPALLSRLGVPGHALRPLLRLHMLDVTASALALVVTGRGMPPRLDPHLPDVLRALARPDCGGLL